MLSFYNDTYDATNVNISNNKSSNISNITSTNKSSNLKNNNINFSNSALIIIDFQNDFVNYLFRNKISELNKIVKNINSLIDKFSTIVYTQELHPKDHIVFENSTTSKEQLRCDDLTEKFRGKFPIHCIKDTEGSQIFKDIRIVNKKNNNNKNVLFLEKSKNRWKEEFSAFNKKVLPIFLRENNIQKLYITGLSLDYFIAYTALDASLFNFKTYIIKDCCSPTEYDSNNLIKDVKKSDVKYCNYIDLVDITT